MGASSGFWPSVPDRRWWHYAAAAPLLAMLVWFPFVRGTRVPILGWVDLAIHEFGHVATVWLPRAGSLAMGSGTQVLVPLGLAAGLWFASEDPLGAGLGLAWTGAAAQDASVYIADAPTQALSLIGGVHDWGTLLGPAHLNRLDLADELAELVWLAGLVLALCGVAVVGWHGWMAWRGRDTGPPTPPPSGWSIGFDAEGTSGAIGA